MRKYVMFSLLFIALSACKKDRGTTWDSSYLTPVAKGEMSMSNLIGDSLIKENGDKSLNLSLERTIYEFESDAVVIPDTVITKSFTLESLIISDRTISQKVTLGQINPAFALLHGTMQNIPAQSLVDVSEVPVDASDFFQTATINTGFLDMTINNELPIAITKVVMQLRNKDDNSIVVTETFTNIPPFGKATRQVPLDGKTVNAELIGAVKELVTQATTSPVLIDVAKGVEMILAIRDLKPQSAIAAFPTQVIMEQDEGLVLETGDAELKKILVKSGKLKIDFYSSIREDMNIYFKIPSATSNGIALEESIDVSGATPGNPIVESKTYDLAGYWIDYRGKNPEITDTVNTFHQILRVTLDSSGRQLPMSLEDSVDLYYGIIDIIPEYAIGYFGSTDNKSGDAVTEFDVLSGVSGDVKLEDATVRLKVTNSLGAGGVLKLNKLSSYNEGTGKEVTLTNTVIPDPINIVPARPNPLRPWEQEYVLDKGNSNIVDFIGNLPNQINYNVDLAINPNGNVSNYNDFYYNNTTTKVSMNVDVPLQFSTSGLTFQDTVSFDFPEEEKLDNVKEANLNLQIENGFPFEVTPSLYFIDDAGVVMDTLLVESQVASAASFDKTTGKVTSPTNSVITITIPSHKMDLLRASTRIIMQGRIKSPDINEKAKIYSTYSIKMKLISDFVYEMGM